MESKHCCWDCANFDGFNCVIVYSHGEDEWESRTHIENPEREIECEYFVEVDDESNTDS